METQLPSGVPSCQSRKWSQIAPATDSAGVRFLACRQATMRASQDPAALSGNTYPCLRASKATQAVSCTASAHSFLVVSLHMQPAFNMQILEPCMELMSSGLDSKHEGMQYCTTVLLFGLSAGQT